MVHSKTADVVIVGAGIMGCAVALRLRQRGLSVLVVERGIPGAEASSAAAGILAPQAEADGPTPFLWLALRSRALYPDFVSEITEYTGIDVGYRREGTLALGPSDEQGEQHQLEIATLRERATWQERLGLRVHRLSGNEVAELEPLLRKVALGLYFPDDHQVEAPLLGRALAQAAAKAGVRFLSAHVLRVLQDRGQAIGVAVEGETLSSAHVVLAAGSWSALVEGSSIEPRSVRPMRGQMLELDTRPPALRHVIYGHVPHAGGTASGYLVPRHDGRIVAGSTMELVGFRKEVTVSGLRRLLSLVEGLAPSLGDAEIRRTWAGFRPYTEDGLPLLGESSIKRLWLCTGHHRNGILLMPISAEATCAAITGHWSKGVEPVDLLPFGSQRLGRNLT